MNKIVFMLTLGIVLLLSSGSFLRAEEDYTARAREINERILNLDSHVDIPVDYGSDSCDPGVLNKRLQVDLVKMREGGLNGVFLVAFDAQGPLTDEGYAGARREVMSRIGAIHRLCEERYPDRIGLAVSPDEVEKLTSQGKLVALIGMENGYVIGRNLEALNLYYDLGVRYMTLCHIGSNDICRSANPAPLHGRRPGGERLDEPGELLLGAINWMRTLFPDSTRADQEENLSDFGRQVVARMNRLGMLVDVSHVSARAFWDVLSVTQAPVIASHSNCRALCDITRNLDDRQLLALRENGGCILINALSAYIKYSPEQRQVSEALLTRLGIRESGFEELFELYNSDRPAYDKLVTAFQAGAKEISERFPLPELKNYVDHIDHVVKLIGVDYVGIGSDFDGGGGIEGFRNAAQAVNVTAELLRRGYTEEEIAKIWGGNLLRVWRRAAEAAAELQKSAPGR